MTPAATWREPGAEVSGTATAIALPERRSDLSLWGDEFVILTEETNVGLGNHGEEYRRYPDAALTGSPRTAFRDCQYRDCPY